MSVYIEGMGMPEDGRYTLCITHDSSGVHWVFQNEDTYEFLKHGRIKELPPHGNLIDRDAARGNIKPWSPEDERNCCTFDTVKKLMYTMLDRAPTIIPADPAEEGEL